MFIQLSKEFDPIRFITLLPSWVKVSAIPPLGFNLMSPFVSIVLTELFNKIFPNLAYPSTKSICPQVLGRHLPILSVTMVK